MIREFLQRYASLTDPQLHLLYLALYAGLATLLVLATLVSVVRRSTGGWGVRGVGIGVVAMASLALLVAFDGVPLEPRQTGVDLETPFRWVLAFTTASAVLLTATAAAARTGLLVAAAHGLAGLGLLIYLVLVTAVPQGVDPTWEVQRLADFVTFVSVGTLGMLAVGFVSAQRQGLLTKIAFATVGFMGVVAVLTGLGAHPRPGVATYALAVLPLVAGGAWLLLLRRRTGAPGRLSDLVASPAWRRAGIIALVASPLVVAGLALALGGHGSARDVARISLLGLEVTPGLMVPFLFAISLGVVLGGGRSGRAVWFGIALTIALAGVMMAQKEVGNTAVILAVAAVVFLVVRGTLPHLMAGGGLAALAVVVAYHLAPVISAIPFTFRERIHLWLGGAELVRRGGHLVAASHVTYDLGGFWGIGIHQTPGMNLPRTIVALDTDFPLAILGLFGGMVLLTVYVALFVCLAVLMLDTVRRLRFAGDTRRARWQAGVLVGLAAVPVASTTINLAGAITQATPFTGVPVAFASYGAIFVLGTFFIVALFVLVANRDVLRGAIRAEAERALRSRGLAPVHAVSEQAPDGTPREALPPSAEPTGRAPWRGRLGMASMALAMRRLRRSLRFRRIDGGLVALMGVMPVIGVGFAVRMAERYTDPTRYYGHPRVLGELRVVPTDEGTSRYAVESGPAGTFTGPLSEGQRLRLDSLVLRFRQGRLQVRGACFPKGDLERGVRLGFAGMLDAPPIPFLDTVLEPVVARLADAEASNDIVLPFGDIALHHAIVRRTGPDTFSARALSAHASLWAVGDDGERYSAWVMGDVRLGQAIEVGAVEPRRFVIDEDPDFAEICMELESGALFEYALSPLGPTVVGGMAVLRRNIGRETVDFEFAERFKQAAEEGLVRLDQTGALQVVPHTRAHRAGWSEPTAKLFRQVFEIVRIRTEAGGEREVLAWNRPFYRDGTRPVHARKELHAFAISDGKLLGLADSYRFARTMPTGHAGLDGRRHGLIYDRVGRPLVRLDLAAEQLLPTVEGTSALLGASFEGRAVRDGLLRVFAPLLRGPDPLPDPDEELADLLRGEWRGPWGWDVLLTLDRDVQRMAFEVVRKEVEQLDGREPGEVHHAQAVVLGPRNAVLAVVQLPDPGLPDTYERFARLREQQREEPLHAPALDAFHRQTTMGSTVKLLTTIAAFRHKEGVIFEERGEWYIDARGDSAYGVRGRYADRGGVVSSWKGKPIVPIRNYGRKSFGRVVSMRDMITHSVNTAASYVGMNVGKERFLDLFRDTGLLGPTDLLPPALTSPHGLGYLLDRFTKDAASVIPLAVAVIPASEKWMLSYTGRLPLSGMSDYTVLKLAAAASIIARDGVYHPPHLVSGVRSRKTGRTTRFEPGEGTRIISPEDAETINSYMLDVVRRGTAASMRWRWGLDKDVWREIAGKTGTGETVVPVKKDVVYDRKNKPKTRDNKVFVGFWPASSPDPYVVVVVYEQVSHLDTRIAIRTVQRIIEGMIEGGVSKEQPSKPEARARARDVRVVDVSDGYPGVGGARP